MSDCLVSRNKQTLVSSHILGLKIKRIFKCQKLEDLIDDAKTCQDLTDCMGASQRVRTHIKQAMKKFQERD
jgi:hypothetical protein